MDIRRGKKNKYGSGPLIFENACARAVNIFFTASFLSVDKYRFIIERQGM